MSKTANTSKQNGGEGDSIKVFVRVRPPIREQEGEVDTGSCLSVDVNNSAIIMKAKPEAKIFTFDQVADASSTQELVFSSVAKKMVDNCLNGYNATIFAYGQTGSGKTFTMIGPNENSFNDELRGVIPRSFEYLFGLINRQRELLGERIQFSCRATFLEIYNEQLYDLLDAGTQSLQLRENIKRGVFVDGLSERIVSTATDAYEVLQAGWTNRSVASTSMNRESSRSHAVFTLHIESKENKGGTAQLRSSQLNLVDLAGSERQKDTRTQGIRLKEGCSINRSLSSLGNVIMALVHMGNDKTRHVPYRDSKLTFLLRDSLGGNAKTHIIACVHPGAKCFGETLSTLSFAKRAKLIRNKAVVNEDMQGNVTALQEEIKRLKDQMQAQEQLISSMTSDGVAPGVVPVVSAEGSDVWQERFVEAMRLYEASQVKLGLEDKRQELLEQQLQQKDRQLMQTKMILRFRDDTIKKWGEERKKKLAEPSEDLVLSLRAEITAAQEYSSSKHDLATLRHQNNKLSREIQSLSQQLLIQDKHLHQLLQDFQEAQKESAPALCTPKQTVVEEPVGTVERQKSQLAKLQAEIDTLKRAHQEEVGGLERQVREVQGELDSVQAARQELEKTLKATQQRASIDRHNQDKIHMDTIKVITTPKKSRLRRSILASTGSTPGTPLVMSPLVAGSPPTTLHHSPTITAEEDGMCETQMPTELYEEQIEGLTIELESVKKEKSELVTKLEDIEKKAIAAVEEKTRIESVYQSLEAKVSENQKTLDGHQSTVASLERGRDMVMEEKELAQGEVVDLRVMLTSTDRHLAEVKAERDQLQQTATSAESQVSSLQYQLEESMRRKADLEIALNNLTEETERLNSELAFTQDQNQELETRLTTETNNVTTALKQAENVHEELGQAQATIQQLTAQLQEQGSEKEKELLGVIQQQQESKEQLALTQQQLTHAQQELASQACMMTSLQTSIAGLERAKKAIEDAHMRLTEERHGLREALKEKETEVEDVKVQIQQLELQLSEEALIKESQMQLVQEEHEHEVSVLKQTLEEKETSLSRLQVQVAMGQEDLDQLHDLLEALQSRISEVESENDTYKTEVSHMTQQNERLSEHISELDNKIAVKEEQLMKETETGGEMQAVVSQLREERDELNKLCIERDMDIRRTQEDISVLTKQIEEQEQVLEEYKADSLEVETKYKEDLKDKEQTIEYWRQIAANSQTQYNDLMKEKTTLELRISQKEVRMAELERTIETHRKQVEEATSVSQQLKRVEEEKESMEEELVDARDQLQRMSAVTSKDQEELTELRSEVETLQELQHHTMADCEELQEKVKKAENEAAMLAGHKNLNQRIQYLQSLKEDNWILSEANAANEKKIILLEKELKVLRTQNPQQSGNVTLAATVASPLRTSTIPTMSTPSRTYAKSPARLTTPVRPNIATIKEEEKENFV